MKTLLVMGQDEDLTPNMPRPEGAEVVPQGRTLVGKRFDVIHYPANEISEKYFNLLVGQLTEEGLMQPYLTSYMPSDGL